MSGRFRVLIIFRVLLGLSALRTPSAPSEFFRTQDFMRRTRGGPSWWTEQSTSLYLVSPLGRKTIMVFFFPTNPVIA